MIRDTSAQDRVLTPPPGHSGKRRIWLIAAIAAAGKNIYYEGLFIRLLDEGRRILRLYYQSFHDQLPQKYVTEHETIIAAIAARDVEKADSLALDHANQIVEQIQQLIAVDRRQKIIL